MQITDIPALIRITRADGTVEEFELEYERIDNPDGTWALNFPPGLTLGNGDSFQWFLP